MEARFKWFGLHEGTKLVPLALSSRRSAGIGSQDCRAFFLVGFQVAPLIFFSASTPTRLVPAGFFVRRRHAAAECFFECVDYAHFKIFVSY